MAITRLSGASGGTTTVKLTKREITWAAAPNLRPATVTETYSDGTTNVRTFTYDTTVDPPRLTQTVDTMPARTEVYTYNADGTVKSVAVS